MVLEKVYQAGSDIPCQYMLRINTVGADISDNHADWLAHYIAMWCQKNTKGKWRIERTWRDMTLWFELSRDFVLFKISEEYNDCFSGHENETQVIN